MSRAERIGDGERVWSVEATRCSFRFSMQLFFSSVYYNYHPIIVIIIINDHHSPVVASS